MTAKSAVLALALTGATAAHAQSEKIKVIVSGERAAIAKVRREAPAELVHEYESFDLISIPAAALDALMRNAAKNAVTVEPRPDFDQLFTPRRTIDTRGRAPVTIPPVYKSGLQGLYMLQLIGPPTSAWVDQVVEAGANVLQALPHNAFMLTATPEVAKALSTLSFVQFVGPYTAHEKALFVPFSASRRAVFIEVANVAGHEDVRDVIERLGGPTVRHAYANDVVYEATLSGRAIEELLAHPLVIGLHHEPNFRPSDERQAQSHTPNITSNGSQPSSPGYATWLLNACSVCTNLRADGFSIGIADSGIGGGSGGAQPVDLQGRITFGGSYANPDDPCTGHSVHCDVVGHGTMVAGVAAGSGASKTADPLGYLLGLGVAPSAGIFTTKIFGSNGTSTGNIYNWAHDARSNGVHIQNHSHNDYPRYNPDGTCCDPATYFSGQYTLSSRQYDYTVRDSNVSWADGVTPISLTVSAGNISQSGADPNAALVLPPATAKNVISVGGAENYRPEENALNCNMTLADDYRNLSNNSKRGTLITGYFKPDLIAPSTMIVSTTSPARDTRRNWCEVPFDGNAAFTMDSGTSFAAPAAAGAAVLVTRKNTSSPGAFSPAAVKAMLIAGTRSVKDGTNRRTGFTNGARPNTNIGFGLLNLADVLTISPIGRYFTDQVHTFTSSGGSWTKTLFPYDTTKPVVVALVWSDAPALAGSTSPLVNNLDLTVKTSTASGCQYSYWGNKTSSTTENSVAYTCSGGPTAKDAANNVEIVRFIPTNVTSFTVTVRATAINGQGVPLGGGLSQDFAIYALNARQ